MVQESKQLETTVSEEPAQENLLTINKNKKENQVLEINKQMTSVEGSIEKLNKKLNATNRKIKSDVERLTTSDAEITDKVADTYKQLGIIDGTFQDLSKQSVKINADLKKVNTTIKALEKSSAKVLNEAIDQQSTVNNEFSQAHEQIIERAEKLSKKATTIGTKLNKSIKDNSKALTELEAKIVSELENIAESSQQRDEQLDNKIITANDEISSQKAKMLLMQSVDEALEKRAAALETTSDKLVADSALLKDNSEVLNILTSKLSADVEALEIHTAKLAQQNQQQQGFIDTLQETTGALSQGLLALIDQENKHFRTLGSISLVLLLALIGVFAYGEYMRDAEQTVEAQRNSVVNEKVGDLQNRVEDEQLASQVFYQEINNLQSNIVAMKKEMQGMNDQVESLDGRVQYLAPLYNFGSDNTIHGSQWLQQLNPELYSIKIATVGKKQDLYEIAQRYSHYFKDELGYFVTADHQYTLIYSGQYDSEQHIVEAMRRMPSFMNHQRIEPISNSVVLQQFNS